MFPKNNASNSGSKISWLNGFVVTCVRFRGVRVEGLGFWEVGEFRVRGVGFREFRV